jgi:hypothetical protein
VVSRSVGAAPNHRALQGPCGFVGSDARTSVQRRHYEGLLLFERREYDART